MTQRVYTDRSRTESYQRCNRLRFLNYHEAGTGIESAKKALPLVVGGAVHTGLEHLLRAGQAAISQYGSYAQVPSHIWAEIEERAVAQGIADFSQHSVEVDSFELSAMTPKDAVAELDLESQLKASLEIAKKNVAK